MALPVYNILVVGEPGVGKTSFINMATEYTFNEKYVPTAGVNIKGLKYGSERPIVFNFWDTAGSEKGGPLHWNYHYSIDAVIVMFDMVNYKAYESTCYWTDHITLLRGRKIPILMLGNKSDVVRRRLDITSTTLRNFKYLTTSAKTQENFDLIFWHLSRMFWGKI
jgi:small GTP-binding protein